MNAQLSTDNDQRSSTGTRLPVRYALFLVGFLLFVLAPTRSVADAWRFSAGLAYRAGMRLEIEGSSYVQMNGLHAASAGNSGLQYTVPTLDDITQYADRQFDDGYVFMDAGTPNDGDTWYWGYDNAGQYSPIADTLTFHRNDMFQLSASQQRTTIDELWSSAVSLDDDLDALGVDLSATLGLKRDEGFSFDLRMGVTWFPGIESDLNAAPYAEEISRTRTGGSVSYVQDSTYTYDLMGVVPPSPPYAGSLDGWPPPSPLIPNRPESLDVVGAVLDYTAGGGSSSRITAYNQVSFDVEAQILELWIGPQFTWMTGGGLTFFLNPIVSMNLVDVEADRREIWMAEENGQTSTLGSWRDDLCESDVLFGLGLHGGVEVALGESWFAVLTGGYDWVPDEFKGSIGPNELTIDISGYSVSVEGGRRF
ncbi:MAG: hypothetical protein KJ626_15755 [Verrucomicrobia bacterium]|nr:hypothetical protein [Verrucomicrobiota bacterium]